MAILFPAIKQLLVSEVNKIVVWRLSVKNKLFSFLFSKTYENFHCVFKICGLKFKFIDKNVGILTYDHSINYGAHLQAYALCEMVRRLGYIPRIIRWRPFYWHNFGRENDNMRFFRKRYLPSSKVCVTQKGLDSILKDFSRIIIGGDQVFRNWANIAGHYVLRYYGDFISGDKTIASYGASFGIDKFEGDDYLISQVKQLLKRFDKIGVREKSGVDILNTTFDVEGTEVLDPVFLLQKEDYIKLIEQNKKIKENNGGYIAYMYLQDEWGLGEVNPDLAKTLSDKKLVNINKNPKDGYNLVEQWLYNLLNADFVITDSFHCAAFSIIFHKPFIVVDSDFGGNERINNILRKFNLEQCRRKSLADITSEDLNIKINWDDVDNILATELPASKKFLEDILTLEPKYKEPYVNPELDKIRKKDEKKYYKSMLSYHFSFLKCFFDVSNEYSNNQKRKVIKIFGIKIKIKRGQKMEEYKTVNYLIAMLKAYGIKYIVSSPGAQNAMFNLLVQEDSDFKCFSVTDERSAAFMAIGLAQTAGEPVVITCTGSSASRNYIPALTEAFYRKVPVIAIPFYNRASNEYNLAAQFVDRSYTQKDIKSVQVKLPEIGDNLDKKRILTYLNAALSAAKYKNEPVVIECPSVLDFTAVDKHRVLPNDIWKTEFVFGNCAKYRDELAGKNVAVFIGSHSVFSKEEENAISEFAKSWDAPVFCDHTSSYHGDNKILSPQAAFLLDGIKLPDLIIDIGGVTGDYFASGLFPNAEVWRVFAPGGGAFHCRYDLPVSKNFALPECLFFESMTNTTEQKYRYFSDIKIKQEKLKYPELPLCNYFIVQNLAKYLPENSILHHGVSNTKRGMNFFNFDETIDITCNVGVCGIDGTVSTLVGSSFVNQDKMCFGIFGDLTFFYDMNCLQNRAITNNLRILLINNNKGIEFKMGGMYAPIVDKVDTLIASAGHKTKAGAWVQSCGFEYMCAASKEEFLNLIKDFCTKKYDKPVLFEVFTNDEDEQIAWSYMYEANRKAGV